jgi:phospho-N-acetylmuramoyl-pentapeptide-transferase
LLYHLLFPLHTTFHGFNVFRYIKILADHQLGQTIRTDGPKSHLKKSGTPTMGGLLILLTVAVSTLLWSDLTNPYVWLTLFVMLAFGFIGWVDDFKKIKEGNSKGLSEKAKMLLMTITAAVAIWIMFYVLELDTQLHIPFVRSFALDLSWFYLGFAWLVIVGTSNAVNLTDGLDGLAIGPIVSTALTFAILSYLAGHARLSEYLYIPYVKDAGELSIFCTTIVCAGMGFLWFNTYPAQVFMGDVGALALGAGLGMVAVISKNELLLALVGGIFVLEAVSVITQRISYKMTKKRIFRMAPIHHHFELSGWAEPQITVRFWIISFVLAMLGLATLKLR